MNKDELVNKGWVILFSGPCTIPAWGSYLVHLHNPVSGHRVTGTGADEETAFQHAATTIEKYGELK